MRSLTSYNYEAIGSNLRGNLSYWGRRAGWCAARARGYVARSAWSLGWLVRALCFVALAGVLMVIMVASTLAFDLLRKAMWHLDENWLYRLERGAGIIEAQDELPLK